MTTMLSKTKLAQILQVKLKHRHPEYEFTLGGNASQDNTSVQINVFSLGGKIFTCSIDNLYTSYLQAPQNLDSLCEPTLEMVKEFLSSTQEDKKFLLPMIVTQERLEQIQNNSDLIQDYESNKHSGIPSIPHMHLVANLFITFVLDKGNRINYLTVEHLKKIQLYTYIEDIYQLSLQNLTALIPQLRIDSSSFFEASLHLNANYEVNMLLIFEQWKSKLPFKTAPAIAIVARDTVILADSTNTAQVKALRKIVSQISSDIRPPFSNQLFTIKNNQLSILGETS